MGIKGKIPVSQVDIMQMLSKAQQEYDTVSLFLIFCIEDVLNFMLLIGTSFTVMILSFRTDRPGQTVQTQIRLLLEEQSDQGLHCLPFRLHRLDSLLHGRAT